MPVTLVMVQHAGHGFKPTGGPVSPSLPQLQQMTVGFFVQRLGSPVR